jgi:hypothetical protein
VLQVESNVVTVKARQFVPLEARLGAEHAKGHNYH